MSKATVFVALVIFLIGAVASAQGFTPAGQEPEWFYLHPGDLVVLQKNAYLQITGTTSSVLVPKGTLCKVNYNGEIFGLSDGSHWIETVDGTKGAWLARNFYSKYRPPKRWSTYQRWQNAW